MSVTIELARAIIAERAREAEQGRLAAAARRVAERCAPASLRDRILAAVGRGSDAGCSSPVRVSAACALDC